MHSSKSTYVTRAIHESEHFTALPERSSPRDEQPLHHPDLQFRRVRNASPDERPLLQWRLCWNEGKNRWCIPREFWLQSAETSRPSFWFRAENKVDHPRVEPARQDIAY